ncbi:TonB family protein [Flavobacterium sp.]|uniref:TonB family protein n=1 Tax=Flavobacterium sp. TaxID=239 RepID=UPI0037502873
MKKIILFFLLISKVSFGQKSNDKIIYLDSLQNEVTLENQYYTKIVKDYYLEKTEYKYLTLYKSGKVKEEKTLSGKDGGYVIGEEISYYENGNKSSSIPYENKKQNGKTYSWYEDGKLKEEGKFDSNYFSTGKHFKMINYWNEKGEKIVSDGNGSVGFKNEYYEDNGNYKNGYKVGKWSGKSLKGTFSYEEIYSDGELVSGISTESDGTKNEYSILEVKPEPVKGMGHFYKYIANNFSAPNSAYKNKIKGKIVVSFVVDKEGEIIEPKIIKSLGTELDNEAIRILTSYDKWKPALQKGRKVRCSFSIPIQLDFTR